MKTARFILRASKNKNTRGKLLSKVVKSAIFAIVWAAAVKTASNEASDEQHQHAKMFCYSKNAKQFELKTSDAC